MLRIAGTLETLRHRQREARLDLIDARAVANTLIDTRRSRAGTAAAQVNILEQPLDNSPVSAAPPGPSPYPQNRQTNVAANVLTESPASSMSEAVDSDTSRPVSHVVSNRLFVAAMELVSASRRPGGRRTIPDISTQVVVLPGIQRIPKYFDIYMGRYQEDEKVSIVP